MGVADNFTSLVALRAKQGELSALRALSAPGELRRVQPLIQLDPSSKQPARQLNAVETVIRVLHALGRPVMLDASDVAHLPGFGVGPVGALGDLADRFSTPAGLFGGSHSAVFVPVIRSDATREAASALSRLGHELERGVALRVRHSSCGNVARIVEWVHHEPGEIDVIVDLEYVAEATAEHIERAKTVLGVLTGLGSFRSTTLLTGSIPKTLGRTAIWEQPRAEEVLWDALVRAGATSLRLGDYGAVHPYPSEGFRSKHVALKYTCPSHWLYARERMPEHEIDDESARAHALRHVCRELVESDSFAGEDYSWGDREIHEAAAGRGAKLGSTSRPVALATSHHLAYLAGRDAA